MTSIKSDELPRNTPTAARRRRPSSKPPAPSRAATPAAGPGGGKTKFAQKPSTRREDKRASPDEVVTKARPKNLKADKNDAKTKGKATHELEAGNPAKRPSRKSRRGGANRVKPDSQQRQQTVRALRSPKHRHAMRSG
jgi:hypothetical protein